jgi:hypothetical protein
MSSFLNTNASVFNKSTIKLLCMRTLALSPLNSCPFNITTSAAALILITDVINSLTLYFTYFYRVYWYLYSSFALIFFILLMISSSTSSSMAGVSLSSRQSQQSLPSPYFCHKDFASLRKFSLNFM